MLMPVNTWGKTFILISTPDRSVGDIYRIVSSESDTVVSLYNSSSYTISKAGNFLELDIPTGHYQTLISDKPVSVNLFAKTWRGPNDGANFGDPAMSIIIPKAQYAADYTWSSVRDPKGNEFNNKVSVVIAKSKVGGLQLDGDRNIEWIEQKEVLGSPDMVHLWVNVTHGSHTLLHDDPTVTFMALVSGTYKVNSYAYLAGLRLADINVDACSKTKPDMGDIVDNDCDGNVDEEKLNGIGECLIIYGFFLSFFFRIRAHFEDKKEEIKIRIK
ncbi:uncharacterized protein [Littorina saxatilis]|uniref:uncharacterized protein n=1 Tax=Littorina saxatilis TaxID=31220 RepID=UPI0038B66053